MDKIISEWLQSRLYTFYSRKFKRKSYSTIFSLVLLFSCYALPVSAQDGLVVSGKVTDETGAGLPGVTIVLKEVQGVGTTTNVDGTYRFKLTEAQKNGILVFSYVGYETQERKINGQAVIDVQLELDSKMLSEIVVVGYGRQEKKDLTGSVASVDAEDLNSLPVPSISDAIQGRISGVQVVSSGVPGSDATLRIRGTGTINNSNPLLVIDGVPTQAGLNQLNPNDIESIQVLKDASAAAIYGSRGANGVVIVTTKGGQEGGKINVDVFTGIQEATNTVEMLNAEQFATLHNEMMINNGRMVNPDFADPASLGEGTDWLGEIFDPASISSYSVSYSGGNDKSNIYVSGNIFNQEGIVLETGYKRYTIQINSDTDISDKLSFGNNLTLNHDVKTSGNYSIRNAMAALPTQPVYDEDGTYAGPTGQPAWAGDILNPVGQAKLIENSTKGYNLIGSLFGEFQILENLEFRSTLGAQVNMWDSRTWAPAYDWEPTPEPDAFLYQHYNKSFTWLWDNVFTYDKLINNTQRITLVAGTSAQENRYDYMNGSVKGFASENTQQLGNGTEQPTLGGNASEWALFSYFGRVNYSYNDKYLATVTIRRDGSSRFGSGNKWGTFPSGSVAWRISEEEFLNTSDLFDDLKLRFGYGLTGNQEIGNYSFASALNTVQYNFNGQIVTAVVPNVMPNPNVKWESVEQLNIGADATILDERVEITLDGYIKNTKDMLVPMAVPVSTGYSDVYVPYINAGEIQNKGIELSISTINTRGKAIEWVTDFNISYNKNKVISLNDTVPMPTGGIGLNYNLARIEAGHSINEFYGFVTNGIFQTQEEVENYALQVPGADPFNRTSPGDIKFLDLNSDGVIDDNDRAYLGNPNPDLIFSLSNNFAYKNFDMSVFLQGVYGNEIFNANRIWSEGMAIAQNQSTETLDRWTGENTSNDMPRAVFNDPNKNTRASDRYIEDGSYMRIKNVTLGYTLPSEISERAGISSARIYLSGQNLFTITNYQGFDPEVPTNGIDFNVYPVTRTVSVGVNIGF